MIATLSGRLRRKLDDRVVIECGGIGYEVYLPPIAMRGLESTTPETGDKASELALVIYYHATRDQPRPVLIGFTSDLDKEFFEKLITVKDIGPMSFTVISRSKNSLSRSEVKPMSTGRGWSRVA